MNILIIANFPANLDGGAPGRFTAIGERLSERGHSVEMLVSDFLHGAKKHRRGISGTFKTKITMLHEPGYPKNISWQRLWSHYQWGRNVERYIEALTTKPDVIYCAVPSLTAVVRAGHLCKMYGIRFSVDVRDLWPEAFMMAVKNKLLQKVFIPLEKYVNQIYSAADGIVGVSETYVNRALQVNKKVKSGLSIYLGNDGGVFDAARDNCVYTHCSNGSLRLAYIGSLSYSYDIKCVIDALSLYNKKKSLPHIKFVVMGRGPLMQEFEQYSKEKDVDCEFTGLVPYSEMVGRMCACDIVINPIVKGSAASIINKVGDYALSGLPVINTQENMEYRYLLEEYHCGINCRVGNAEDVADALVRLAKNPELRKEMGRNGRRLGEERFDRRKTYQKIIELIEAK